MNASLVALAALAGWVPSWAPPWMGGAHRAPPPEIWHGARFGMNERQVLKLFPAARPTVAGESLSGDTERASMLTRVADHDAVAHFYFGKKGLSTVELEFADVEAGRTAGNLAEARELGEQLARKYGPADACAPPDPRLIVQSYRCRWSPGLLHIELEYREAAPPPILTVVYRINIDAAGSGL